MFNIELIWKIICLYIILVVIAVLCALISLILPNTEKNINAFNNNEVLVCGTLIVSNSNWNLVNNHLINTNSAGYINIENCEAQE